LLRLKEAQLSLLKDVSGGCCPFKESGGTTITS